MTKTAYVRMERRERSLQSTASVTAHI